MRTNEEIISLIQSYVDEKGISMSELARRVGIAKSTMSRYFNKTREFPLNRADDFAKALNMKTADLLGIVYIDGDNNGVAGDVSGNQNITGEINGTVAITNNGSDNTEVEKGQEVALETQNELRDIQKRGGDVRDEILEVLKDIKKDQRKLIEEVKRLSVSSKPQNESDNKETDTAEELYPYQVYERLSAGTGSTVWDDGSYDTVYFDEELNHDIASWISGDSMEPTYQNGEVALIKKTGFDYDGAVYAVVWDGQTYIKKVYREEDGLRLVSLNKKYRDKFASYEEEPRVIGLVTGHFMPVEK